MKKTPGIDPVFFYFPLKNPKGQEKAKKRKVKLSQGIKQKAVCDALEAWEPEYFRKLQKEKEI